MCFLSYRELGAGKLFLWLVEAGKISFEDSRVGSFVRWTFIL